MWWEGKSENAIRERYNHGVYVEKKKRKLSEKQRGRKNHATILKKRKSPLATVSEPQGLRGEEWGGRCGQEESVFDLIGAAVAKRKKTNLKKRCGKKGRGEGSGGIRDNPKARGGGEKSPVKPSTRLNQPQKRHILNKEAGEEKAGLKKGTSRNREKISLCLRKAELVEGKPGREKSRWNDRGIFLARVSEGLRGEKEEKKETVGYIPKQKGGGDGHHWSGQVAREKKAPGKKVSHCKKSPNRVAGGKIGKTGTESFRKWMAKGTNLNQGKKGKGRARAHRTGKQQGLRGVGCVPKI